MVLPSEYEPFAVVVNESMCCGCPVVTSDCVGAAPDLVAPVAPQFVFPRGDIEALANILKAAFAHSSHLQLVSRAALAHIQTWSPERNIAATVDAIRIAVARVGRLSWEPGPESSSPGTAPAASQKLHE
jgi:glycosyltransferase involved in cell wall biosynthesis